MRPLILVITATWLVAVVAVTPAMAHAGLMPGELAPNTTEEAELVLVHGCGPGGTIPTSDDQTLATTAVTLEVPEDVALVVHEQDGWRLNTESGPDGLLRRVRWDLVADAGTLDTIFLGVEVTVPDLPDGTEIWLPVVQECVDGEQLAWTYEGVDAPVGQLPAMRLIVKAAAASQDASTRAAPPTGLVITLAVALAVLAGGVVFAVSGRRP